MTAPLVMIWLSGKKFDLIILDVMLPEINGIELCQKIRAEKYHGPILMLTAKGQVTDKVRGLDIGADDYMVKPFSFEELFARIRALIRRPQTVTSSILKAQDLTLDTVTFQVTRNNQPVSLSTKEFSILEYLLRHPNMVISKEQLITHIWSYDTDVLPSVIEVHIKHLRDKIDVPFSSHLIKTVRGRGYMIKR
jgi:DNA-binding response OmpR family regulator